MRHSRMVHDVRFRESLRPIEIHRLVYVNPTDGVEACGAQIFIVYDATREKHNICNGLDRTCRSLRVGLETSPMIGLSWSSMSKCKDEILICDMRMIPIQEASRMSRTWQVIFVALRISRIAHLKSHLWAVAQIQGRDHLLISQKLTLSSRSTRMIAIWSKASNQTFEVNNSLTIPIRMSSCRLVDR
jgi:hypothetical protein